jgi:hypothetical protein
MFFLQTLSFLAFVIDDKEVVRTIYLYNMNVIYLRFGNVLESKIPWDYFESSSGNFAYLAGDSNIIRLTGTTLVIAAATALMSLSLRGLWLVCKHTSFRHNLQAQQFVLSRKRFTYRFLEFLYKTCMYPLLFFSFVTFWNWNAMVLTSHTHFHNISRGLAVTLFLTYLLVTFYQVWWETIAKVNKVENALEFGSACIASLIICGSIHSRVYLLLTLLFCFRAGVYVMLRRRILRDFRKIEYLKLLSTLLEILALVCSVTDS